MSIFSAFRHHHLHTHVCPVHQLLQGLRLRAVLGVAKKLLKLHPQRRTELGPGYVFPQAGEGIIIFL